MSRRLRAAVLTLVLGFGLSACAAQEDEGTMTLDEAKREYLAVQAELRALIPDDVVVEDLGTKDKASLLPCGLEPTGFSWPGSTAVTVHADTDTVAILDDISAAWQERSDWTVDREGPTAMVLERADGLYFSVAALEGNTQLRIAGFSLCFELPDHDPHAKY